MPWYSEPENVKPCDTCGGAIFVDREIAMPNGKPYYIEHPDGTLTCNLCAEWKLQGAKGNPPKPTRKYTGIKCPNPECDGAVLEMKDKKGVFYGCSRFPYDKWASRELPSLEDKSDNEVEQYDAQLKKDIWMLEKYIQEHEQQMIQFMRSVGDSEEVIQEVVNESRREGTPVSLQYGSNRCVFDEMRRLRNMLPVYKRSPFRIVMSEHTRLTINVVTDSDCLCLNASVFSDSERKKYTELLRLDPELNYHLGCCGVYNRYPTRKFMNFMARMLAKYKSDILIIKKCQDNK